MQGEIPNNGTRVQAVELPTGTVTFLFTDIEGSTRLLEALGDQFRGCLEDHARLLRGAITEAGGIPVSSEGDAIFGVFREAASAVRATAAGQRAIADHPWPEDGKVKVRMGLHTGEGRLGGDNYWGLDVHVASRIAAAANGGQVVLSDATRSLVESQLPAGISLRDLGRHRLKDLRQPQQLFQLEISGLASEFPPLRTLNAIPNNLPAQVASFIGRERELAKVTGLVGETRLVTLTGPGGTGKTRLALQSAAEIADRFTDGVYYVDLSSVFDPGLVASEIAMVLGVTQSADAPLERLKRSLADRRLLLVLDNFEQILAAAPVVSDLLRAAPELRVLVTSRAALRVSGEREFPVPPLGVPDLEHLNPQLLDRIEAVALFQDRARAAKPDFAITADNARAIAEIAVRLDGLPLALELAAARTKLLPPQAIVGRLTSRFLVGGSRDLPTRQQTLKDTIAWSYDLLSAPLQRFFDCLSVFAGGCALEEAEAVCGPMEDSGGDVLDALGVLIDQSLLRQEEVGGEARFRMLETIREFAAERLEIRGERAELRRKHASVYTALAQRAAPHFLTRSRLEWLDRIELEHDNLRAAIAWSLEEQDADIALQLGASLWRFWQIRGHLQEGWERIQAIRAVPGGTPARLSGALEAAGGIAYWRGDFESAKACYSQALDIDRERSDPSAIANSLLNLGIVVGQQDDIELGRAMLEEGAELYRKVGDEIGEARMWWGLGDLEFVKADWAKAIEYIERCLPVFRAADDPFWLGWSLFMRSVALTRLGNPGEGERSGREALRSFMAVRDVSGITMGLGGLASIGMATGDLRRAALLAGAHERLRRQSGTDLASVEANRIFGLDEVRATLGEEEFTTQFRRGEAMTFEESVAFALGENVTSQ